MQPSRRKGELFAELCATGGHRDAHYTQHTVLRLLQVLGEQGWHRDSSGVPTGCPHPAYLCFMELPRSRRGICGDQRGTDSVSIEGKMGKLPGLMQEKAGGAEAPKYEVLPNLEISWKALHFFPRKRPAEL